MKINANSIRMGNIINYKEKLWSVIKPPEHTMPGKGGAFIQLQLRDIVSGTKLSERFRSNEYIERVRLEEREYQYLYTEGNFLTLMDIESFEQINVDKNLLGEKVSFLKDGMMLTVESYEGKPLNIILPDTLVVEVKEADAVIKGQTAAASNKPAILENGVRVMVPPFINSGDKIIIKTEDISYVERAKN